MKKKKFQQGEFAVWKNNVYRINSYQNELELFSADDTERLKPLRRIPKDEAEDRYYQLAWCDIKNVRYIADSVRGDEVTYKPHSNSEYFYSERIDQCNEIWLERRRGEHETETEDIWLSPYCMKRPSSQKFYAEPTANGGIMEVHSNELLSFDETAKVLTEAFGDRIKINDVTALFSIEYYTTFELDGKTFDFDIDCWELVGISPKYKEDSYLIHEIVRALNKYSR